MSAAAVNIMHRAASDISKGRGLSLIELLVSMVLGLTLATGVVQIYVGSSTTERDREARQRIQENGRFATNFLSQEIRMAGYLGCLSSIEGASVNNVLNGPPATFQPQFGVQGWEATGTNPGVINNGANDVAVVGTNTAEWTNGEGGHVIPTFNAVPNSDIIRIWNAAGSAGLVTSITEGASASIQAESAAGIAANDFLILSDCEQADFVQACAVVADAAPATTSTITLSSACNPGNDSPAIISSVTSVADPAEVVRLEGTIFYVGKRNDTATNSSSLFRRQLSATGTAGVAEELIEGVESMQILYGVNVDIDVRNTVDSYLPANLVTEFSKVISVRISLLMQSVEDGSVPAPQIYTFDGVLYDGQSGNGALPVDTRVRRVFTNTISLRNRALGT
ncbi:MAG: pilus assembly protein PilW [SAR86 cluster bacterium]|uniref:Pilus assembly protein PilW n=1 Tax=SAR86 cluster bacterium TaxID=2030880 RepID=A0A2A4WWD9_9GAMM|nr:MAG: pilus assembly protein PilW [SAR86 cluster bacterium]